MTKWQYKLITALFLVSMSACGGGESSKNTTSAQAPAPAPAPVIEAVVKKKPVAKPVKSIRDSSKTYRSVVAKSRDNGGSVEIMVPSDVEIGSGRLIEYREDIDGTLYFVSLIPQ